MKLTARARYAVRLVFEVSRLGGKSRPVRLRQIAQLTGISRKFMEQLAIALRSHSLLRGVCGRNGGYVLARAPETITIGDVVRAVDGPTSLSICVDDPMLCMRSEFCENRLLWCLLQQRIRNVLDEFTIADLLAKERLDDIRNELASSPIALAGVGGMVAIDSGAAPACARVEGPGSE